MVKKTGFVLSILLVIGFFVWTKLFLLSLVLLLFVDFIFCSYVFSKIKKSLGKSYDYFRLFFIMIITLSLAVIVRRFFIEVYYVPSSSMEDALHEGDYVVVDKFSFGTKVPARAADIPLLGKFFTSDSQTNYDLYKELSGYKEFQRNDIVVFRSVYAEDRFFVKRIIGMPGEELIIKNTNVFADKKQLDELDSYQFFYHNMENPDAGSRITTNREFDLNANSKLKRRISKPRYGAKIIFPFKNIGDWSIDNYGPIHIPEKGQQITLTEDNIILYKEILRNFESVSLEKIKAGYVHKFQQQYYFVLGDNRQNSIDSRYYGFVPEIYVQGKVITSF